MHRFFLFFLISILITSCINQFQKLPDEKINSERIEIAETFALKFMQTLKSGTHYEFSDEEAIDELVKALTPDLQKDVYSKLVHQNGDFQKLEFTETWINPKKDDFEVYRFKGFFKKNENPLEIRVVLDRNNKIAGFWIKKWRNNLNLG